MSNYAFEGPKWSTSVITWSFAAAGGDFSNAISGAYQTTIRAAIARWSQVVNLTFQQVADSKSADIRIGWASFSGTQVGETDYSFSSGATKAFVAGTEVRLEDPAARAIGTGINDYYQGTSTTLYEVALHEIGHALGLDHSTDPTAVMYPSVGPSDNGLGASDIQGIQTLYGAPAVSVAQNTTTTVPIMQATANMGSTVAVYRFFDTSNGTQFLTASASERATVMATRPDLTYQGVGLAGITPGTDASAIPVYRFFDTKTGTHFFTSDQSEENSLVANRPDLVLEQTTFNEHATQQAGDVPVYRFFDKADGTHFYTASGTESSNIIASRSDMAFEGIAFYSPSSSAATGATAQSADATANVGSPIISISDDTVLVYGFESSDGRQFLTADQSERDALFATAPTMTYQGAAMGAISPDAGDADAAPVFRFFDVATGDHFLTANVDEAAKLTASRPDMVDEQTVFYEHLTQKAGDVAIYRFFDTATGTHLYTANAAGQSAAGASQPDLTYEGIAFYAPSISRSAPV